MAEQDAPDLHDLQALNRDLVALLALPAMWTATATAGPAAVIEVLLDVLLSMLRLDWVFARIEDSRIVLARVDRRLDGRTYAPLIDDAVRAVLRPGTDVPAEIADPCGTGRVRIAPIRFASEGALIVAASRRQSFPSQRDLLVLRVASNQTAIGLQAAKLMETERRHASQLAKLADAALAIHSQPSLSGVLHETTERARDIIGAHQAVASLTEPATFAQSIHAVSLSDSYAAWRGYAAKPDGAGIYRVVCETNRPMRLTQHQLETHPAWRGFGDQVGLHPPLRGWLAVPLVARDGSNLGLVQLSDKYVGDFDQADERMLVQLAQLAAVAVENTLLNEDMRASRERALEADRRKDEFLALLGHELRNPLAPILSALDLLKLRGTGDARRELAVIERHVRHVMRLVDDLLDISRVTRGKLELRSARVEIAAVIAKALELARPLISERHHDVDFAIPEKGLEVTGDPVRLVQVFTNLVANAAKYTPAGGCIRIRADGSANDVEIAVTDNGNGIPTELLPRVFEMFVQGARGVDRAEGGLGLGLAIVRTLVEVHGGKVAAESEGPGKGSTFRVTLPRSGHGPLAHAEGGAAPAPPALEPRVRRSVLVVDDNDDARELLADALEMLGHSVHRAANGDEALALAAAHDLDVALVDIGLPVIDGFEVARRLRTLKGGRVRLFAVTGYGQTRDRDTAVAAGFDRHFVKPVDFIQLEDAISSEAR